METRERKKRGKGVCVKHTEIRIQVKAKKSSVCLLRLSRSFWGGWGRWWLGTLLTGYRNRRVGRLRCGRGGRKLRRRHVVHRGEHLIADGNGHCPSVSVFNLQRLSGRLNAENAVGGQRRGDRLRVDVRRKEVLARELPRHVPVVVGLVLVLANHHDGVVHCLYGDLLRREVRHVHHDLVLVAGGLRNYGAGAIASCGLWFGQGVSGGGKLFGALGPNR